ncbi:dihydrofolate reductase family protein [Pseudaminobacter soli (ex Li et al. 2025)]|uniref:Dihydrofolate reductase n=1 Tax=Pseudaminobacter soli (ex Li et al. 2025) TaxID=1295366 RepID=A0A2P7S718_9HYPH|nr:dihydrofolate reductase family protein [Mesorhizobium soli]PSJ58268.1 dihydrofolate reductase [Mesorhizobium soli]
MRTINAAVFVSLDGVMQAPGGPQEDPTGGFQLAGWVAPHFDDALGGVMGKLFETPFDLLLGRRTYDIFAAHWPYVKDDPTGPLFDGVTKYVATHDPDSLTWQNTKWLGIDVPAALRKLKQEDGPQLLIQGSSQLIQQLLEHDLIDRFQLIVMPIVLGKGKKLFGNGTMPAALKLTNSLVTPKGVVVAAYERAGEVETGDFGLENPSEAELERRRGLAEMERKLKSA